MDGSGGGTVEAVDRALLAQTAIFAGLSDAVLEKIFAAARIIRVEAGQSVIEEGDLSVGVFVLCDGELEICKRGRNGAEFCLAVMKRGDCVGEMSLIDVQARSATVRALGAATLFVLDQAAITRLYKTDLEVYTLLMLNIAREISRRLRQADQTLVDMGVAMQDLWRRSSH
ncbi:MAG TPA: cyclic nucleotide-binding domain-containing protein [Polyangia bacterium]|nr:cyclic nucleotide-binding domain-containing protein [Polyangia bacterium]